MKISDEALIEGAQWLDRAAAALERKYERQLRIDPEWTTLEIEPDHLGALLSGLKGAAETFRALCAAERTP
jgi:hypothetical protein